MGCLRTCMYWLMCLLCATHTGLCFLHCRLLYDYIAKLLARRICGHPLFISHPFQVFVVLCITSFFSSFRLSVLLWRNPQQLSTLSKDSDKDSAEKNPICAIKSSSATQFADANTTSTPSTHAPPTANVGIRSKKGRSS